MICVYELLGICCVGDARVTSASGGPPACDREAGWIGGGVGVGVGIGVMCGCVRGSLESLSSPLTGVSGSGTAGVCPNNNFLNDIM